MIPPVGLNIINRPADSLFEMYLDGQVSALKMVGLKMRRGSVLDDNQIDFDYQQRIK